MAFPSPVNSALTEDGTNQAAHAITMPSSIVAGRLLLVKARFTTTGAVSASAGWTELFNSGAPDSSSGDRVWIGYKIAAGGDTLTLTSAGTPRCAAIAWQIDVGGTTPTVELSSSAGGTSTAPNPPSFSPSGGAKDYLWMWLGGWEGEQTSPPTGAPTNYSGAVGADTGTAGGVATNCQVAGAWRQLNASSEDPPAWTISVSDDWSAWTLAIANGAGASPQTVVAPLLADTVSVHNPVVSQSAASQEVEVPRISNTRIFDDFDRSVSNGWGTAPFGGQYDLSGTSARFQVASGIGSILTVTTETQCVAGLYPGQGESGGDGLVEILNTEVLVKFRIDKVGTEVGDHLIVGFRLRSLRGNPTDTYYRIRIRSNQSSNQWEYRFDKAVDAVVTDITGSWVGIAGSTADEWWWARIQVFDVGPTTIRFRIWKDGDAEGSLWNSDTDTESALENPGGLGLMAVGSASGDFTVDFDDLLISDLDAEAVEVFSPEVAESAGQSVIVQLLSNAPSLFLPVVSPGGVAVVTPLLVDAVSANSPTISPGAVTVVAQKITQALSINSPQITQNVAAQLIAALTQIYNPQVRQQVVAQLIENGHSLHNPSVAQLVVMNLLLDVLSISNPTVVPGAVTVAANLIDIDPVIYSPQVIQKVIADIIRSTETLVPDAIVSAAGYAGATVSEVQTEDGDYAEASLASSAIRFSFPTPTGTPRTGGYSLLRAKIRARTDDVTARIEYHQAGSLVVAGSNKVISAGQSDWIEVVISNSLMTNLPGAQARIDASATSTSADIDIVEWIVSTQSSMFHPSAVPTSRVLAELLQQAVNPFDPQVLRSVAANLIDQDVQVSDPSVTTVSVVVVDTLEQVLQVFNPSISPGAVTVVAQLLDSGHAVHSPLTTQGLTVVPQSLSNSPLLFDPALLHDQVVVVGELDSDNQVYDPAVLVGALTVVSQLINNPASVLSPSVAQQVVAQFIDNPAEINDPSVAMTVISQLIQQGIEVYLPDVTTGAVVSVGVLDSGHLVFNPEVVPGAITIQVGSLESLLQAITPLVTPPEQIVEVDGLTQAPSVELPDVLAGTLTVQAESLAAAPMVYGPTVYFDQFIVVGIIDNPATLNGPRIFVGVVPTNYQWSGQTAFRTGTLAEKTGRDVLKHGEEV